MKITISENLSLSPTSDKVALYVISSRPKRWLEFLENGVSHRSITKQVNELRYMDETETLLIGQWYAGSSDSLNDETDIYPIVNIAMHFERNPRNRNIVLKTISMNCYGPPEGMSFPISGTEPANVFGVARALLLMASISDAERECQLTN